MTDREVDVLRLAAQGLTMRHVASRLGIPVKTVDHHLQRIYAKTGVTTRGAWALFAIEQGLVRPTPVDDWENARADWSLSSEPRKNTFLPSANRHQCCMYIDAVLPVAFTV